MYQTVSLTSGQRQKIQNQKQLYVLLKMINFTQKYYSYDKIDANTYKTQIGKYIQKYNRFTQVIPGYNFQAFLKKYSIPPQEVSWAKLVLEKGVHTQENQSKQTFLFMQAAVKFIEVFDCLNMNADNPVVGQIRPPLLLGKLGSEFTQKFREYERLLKSYVQTRSITQSLAQSEFTQLKLNLESMYRMMELIMKS